VGSQREATGRNGVNTVYFIDTTGKACPNGAGVPQPGAELPTSPIDYNPALLQSEGGPHQPEWHGRDLGGHVDGVRQRDQGADPNKLVAITDRLPATASGRRAVRHCPVGRLWRDAARRVPHARHRFLRLVTPDR
jgi:hypothetical protein